MHLLQFVPFIVCAVLSVYCLYGTPVLNVDTVNVYFLELDIVSGAVPNDWCCAGCLMYCTFCLVLGMISSYEYG